MKRLMPYSLILIATIILGACAGNSARSTELYGGASAPVEEPYYDQSVAPAPTMMVANDAIAQESAPASGEGGGNANAAQVERIVIQNADISVVVSDVELRLDEIQKMVFHPEGHYLKGLMLFVE